MSKLSAGVICYRYRDKELQVMLVHPGGPFWKNKDEGAWSIPKGEYEDGEDPLAVAKREFTEETGNVLPEGNFLPLQPIKTKSGKLVTAWAIEADFDRCFIESNFFEMEWPPRSGKKQSFPEVDNAAWFSLAQGRKKINTGQLGLLDQLIADIGYDG